MGMCMGGLDTGSNVMLIYLYKADVGPLMQSMHASFAIGAFFAPALLCMTERPRAHAGGESSSSSVTSGSYDITFYLIGAYCVAVAAALLVTESPKPRKGELHHGEGDGAASGAAPIDAAASGASAPAGADAVGGESRLVLADGNAENGLALETLDGAASGSESKDAGASSSSGGNGVGGHAWHGEVVPVVPDSPAAPAAAAAPAPSSAPTATFKRQRWVVILVTALLLLQYVGCEAGESSHRRGTRTTLAHTTLARAQLPRSLSRR